MKSTVLGAAIAAGLMMAAAADAAMVKNAGSAGVVPPGIRAPAAVLYSQLDNPAGNGVPDQDFEAGFDGYDSIAADDFVVTDPSGWTIQQVSTVGTYDPAGRLLRWMSPSTPTASVAAIRTCRARPSAPIPG